ncbi:MAG: hypothetical protein Q4F65_09075 [Propionibacteriaceae bacterium]|nr:hypothetical protein [Propionibacteriaceae bacterium]
MVLLDLGRELAPSWAPFGAAMLLLVLLALLWFSMRRHLKRAAKFSGEEGADIHAPRMGRADSDPKT